jgi:predicted dienelactone hydrolase
MHYRILVAALATVTLATTAGAAQPDLPGPYGIGHTTVVITDTSRNPDGSQPLTTPGRPLYLHLWYPTSVRSGTHVAYTWNDPVYNRNAGGAVYPGLPDVPALTFTGAASYHAVAEGAPLARETFPLVISTHGLEVAAAKSLPDTLETLASHGYVVASVEHTGNDDAYYQAYFLENYVGLPLGPDPAIATPDVIYQRVLDVSFVISAVLGGTVDQATGLPLSAHVDPGSIGVIGYSLGGETSLASVAGISRDGLAADRRIKAAFMGGGSNYGLLLDAADYANVRVPLLFYGNDTGIAWQNFNAFTSSPHKYLVDVGGINHHTAGYQSSWCQDFHNSMVAVNPAVFPAAFVDPASLAPSDIANFVFDATFYFSYTGPRENGVYDYCEPSVFSGVSAAQLTAIMYGDPTIVADVAALQPSMPLRPEVSIAATTRIANQYALAFFDSTLKHERSREPLLQEWPAGDALDPLVNFVADCERVPAQPLDLQPGDRIAFTPAGADGYSVSVTSGASLLSQGGTKLAVAGDGSATLNYPGFSFPVPGAPAPVATLIVAEDGVITTATSPDYTGVDHNGSPWYMKGQLLLGGEFTIGALMKDLDSSAAGPGGGVFAWYDSANSRVIVTWSAVPAAGTTAPNTLQVVINASGEIDLVVGELAATGPAYAPAAIGTIGIANGRARARDLRFAAPTRFGELRDRGPVFIPTGRVGAIFEQYTAAIAGSCRAAR